MRLPRLTLLLLAGSFLFQAASYAQAGDSLSDKLLHFPSRLISRIGSGSADLDKQITRQTEKYLAKMASQEKKLKKQMAGQDSVAAGTQGTPGFITDNTEQRYATLISKIKSDTSTAMKIMHGEYLPHVDSLQGLLRFLQANPAWLSSSKIQPSDVQNALSQLSQLQTKMEDAGEIQQFMQQRQVQIKAWLSQYSQLPAGVTNTYKEYNEQLYYYTEQVKKYKETLNDPDKMMQLGLSILDKLPAFTNFMKSNSFLSGIFNLPGTYNPAVTGQGLSTRDQVLAAFQNQAGPGGPDLSSVVRQNVQSAQGQVDQLRAKLTSYGNSGGADIDVPDFQPNSQKVRSFLQRLEYGMNIQTVRSTNFFPSTTDIGLSIGYKVSDKNVFGVGASYKIGWGQDINHISLSSQGASLRSFLDINIKNSFYASSGFEFNYQQPFALMQFPGIKNWQPSGLLGITKIISLKTKVFKKTKIQLLWDFLSYEQIPKAQPFKFRVGYSF